MKAGMKLIRMNLVIKLIFCIRLGIHKHIRLSPFIWVWSGKPGDSKSNSEY